MELNLTLDDGARKDTNDLMKHYGLNTQAKVISKAMAVLKTAAYIESEGGELFARKGDKITKIIVR